MIDLHCHILPGLDDGAADMEDSVAMARCAARDGVTAICATPHIRHDHDVYVPGLARRVARLNMELREAGVPITVLRGGELAATKVRGMRDGDLATISLGGSGRWLLLEPAPGPLDDSLDEAVRDLERCGYRSLIAHPERHLAHDMRERLARLVGQGALVQATADTLLNECTRDGILELAGLGLVHVLGSDAHSSRYGRAPRIAAALRVLAGACAQPEWSAEHAPAAIVSGLELDAPRSQLV